MSEQSDAPPTFPMPGLVPLRGADLQVATRWLEEAAAAAADASCLRSSCGTVIVDAGGQLVAGGANTLPGGAAPAVCRKDCGLGAGFKSDRTCCTHAEVRAIVTALRAGADLRGARLYFARLGADRGRKSSGQPYCTICSKMAVEVGIAYFVLEHDFGVVEYPSDVYNELSFAYGR